MNRRVMTYNPTFGQDDQKVYGPQTNIAGNANIYPPADPTPPPREIPPRSQDFTGRDDELRDLLSSFKRGATIVGLRGMGGVGKTALALVLAEQLKDRFPDGQIFVQMAGTSEKPLEPSEAMAHVIRAYHPELKMPDNKYELQGLYNSVLSGKSVLLLLDNASDRGQVKPLLPPSGCAMIFTSREKFALPGLEKRDLYFLPLEDSEKLLLQIARRIGDHAEDLAKLCGCLPIALRNAAYTLAERDDLGLQEYLNRLKDGRKRLELVEASFSLSYGLLSPELKKLWSMLSVFPSDFDRVGAAAVWETDYDSAAEVLSDLLKLSLVEYLESEGRYHQHDLARIFADDRLEEDSDAGIAAGKRHAEHYRGVLAAADELYLQGGEKMLDALKLFDSEWANIAAGQAWAERYAEEDLAAAALCGAYPDDGANILDLRLNPRERIRWREAGLAGVRQLKDRAAEGAHLGNLGIAYADLGEPQRAIEFYELALSILHEIGDKKGESGALNGMGNAFAALGEPRRAIEHYERALTFAREIGDRRGEGTVLGNLGLAYADIEDPQRAIELYNQHLAIASEIGDKRGEGTALSNLGAAYADLGKTQRAIEHYERRLAIAHKIGDRRGEGITMFNVSLAFDALNNRPKAIDCAQAALAIFEAIESPQAERARQLLADLRAKET
ncbi:MAG: tetratricopeptide repeat protein [Methanotrichaceae archaeon]|nr:tetratricopeptide repeat protein [Methanotrichaceae archaeon]